MIGGITLEDFRRVMSGVWDEVREENCLKKPEKTKDLRKMDQCFTNLEQGTRQPRLAMEADVPAEEKTRKRTKGAARAAQTMHGDSFFASRVQAGPNTTSTSFGVKAEPPALPCRDDTQQKIRHGFNPR